MILGTIIPNLVWLLYDIKAYQNPIYTESAYPQVIFGACFVSIIYGFSQIYFVAKALRPLYISCFKYIFPLILSIKWIAFYFLKLTKNGLTDEEKFEDLLAYLNLVIDVISVLSILVAGCFIDKRILFGKKMRIFHVPLVELEFDANL